VIVNPHPSDEARKLLNRTGGVLAVGSLIILGVIAVGLIFVRIPKENESMMFALVGGVIGLVTMAFGYFFGSTHQAKVQTETIENMSRQAAQSGPSIIAQSGDTVRTDSQTHSQTRVE
jgi:hypothetical protein